MKFDVVVYIPKGQRNKYDVDHETGRIRLSTFPFDQNARQHPD
jgi:inorganic pyrophosphatase